MKKPRIAILIDLPREAAAGGHVKYWERVARAAAAEDAPVDLTLYFSGLADEEILTPYVRLRSLPPVFSTDRLKFLSYVPAHTDLAPFHPALAQELADYDLIHTTDAYFAFARTAERVARWHNIPLVTSFHTDTPAYAEIFTRHTLHGMFGRKLGNGIDRLFGISVNARLSKEKRLKKHLQSCAATLALRPEDKALALSVTATDKIRPMRLGVDKEIFHPNADARVTIEADYHIAPNQLLVLFVGRIDAGKNVPLLTAACAAARDKGVKLHLILAGQGPLGEDVKKALGTDATLVGLVDPHRLASLYAAADCLAIASDIEIGGMIGLEALACGCPVLVSRQSGVAQLCGETAAMRQVDSTVRSWVTALSELALDTEMQKTMRAAALAARDQSLASWHDVLNEDFIPIWQKLAAQIQLQPKPAEESDVRQTHPDPRRAS